MRRVGGGAVTTTPRPFRAGDRVRWTAPTEADRAMLASLGRPTEDECTVLSEPESSFGVRFVYVTASYEPTGHAACPVSWLTHIDDVPAPAKRDPDKQCRWCHGTGAVLLVFSHAPCECVGGGS